MGELVVIQQRGRRSPLPATLGGFGVLGSSKPASAWTGGTPGPAPAVAVPSPGQVAAVLQTLNTIASPEAPQKITATGDTLRTPVMKARALRPPPVPPPPPVYVPIPYVWPGGSDPANNPPPLGPGGTVAPGPAFPGGDGGAAAGADQGAAEAPVFLGLTQKQLLIGGALAVAAYFLLRKKKTEASRQPSEDL